MDYFKEPYSAYSYSMHALKKRLVQTQSPFQTIDILDTYDYGKALFLDGKIQSAEIDEHLYHEALVHPVLLSMEKPEKVLVIGGGEGATLREIYKHPSVKRVVMVELDEKVVTLSKEFLPEWNAGAFDDSRTELVFQDGRAWLENSQERFDAIFLDLNEPVEEGPAYMLYTKEFYKIVSSRLSPTGIVMTQAGPSHGEDAICLASILKTMREVFPVTRAITAVVPSFQLPWAFAMAATQSDPKSLSDANVDSRIEQRKIADLQWYDGETHHGLFSLAKDVRELVKHKGMLIEDAKPLYMQMSKV